jgi:glutathione peroxidase
LTNKNYAELGDLCTKLAGQSFHVLAFPCNQFGGQESGSSEEIRRFVTNKLAPIEVDFTVMEKVDVNGQHAHPVWQFLRHNAREIGRAGKAKPVPWNFSKFLVDRQGRVVRFFGPTVATPKIESAVRAVLSGDLCGAAARPPTVSVASDAVERMPTGSGIYGRLDAV